MNDYFGNDEYWKVHIDKKLEDDIWIDEYKEYFNNSGLCLDLGCGIGQYSKRLMEYGYNVVSADISDIALNKVKEFNDNVKKIDMRKSLPFEDSKFDMVFANLSIHYFSDTETKKLMKEISRILKDNGLFIGSVNGIQGFEKIKDTATIIDYHYYFNNGRCIRLFDINDTKMYLNGFNILTIDEKETIRFGHQKNYIVFIAKKEMIKIESKRLILREYEDKDVEDIVEGLNNIEVSKWMASVPFPYTEQDAKDFIERNKNQSDNSKIMLAIVLKENNKVIGGTEIRNINKKDGTAGGGIWLNEKYQRNGYGTEAFSARNKYCFEVLGLRRIENGYFPGNEKSHKMQLKLGYKDEGIRRKKFLCLATNQYVDECVTGLLKEDFIEYKI